MWYKPITSVHKILRNYLIEKQARLLSEAYQIKNQVQILKIQHWKTMDSSFLIWSEKPSTAVTADQPHNIFHSSQMDISVVVFSVAYLELKTLGFEICWWQKGLCVYLYGKSKSVTKKKRDFELSKLVSPADRSCASSGSFTPKSKMLT